jgi:hypothetical protein
MRKLRSLMVNEALTTRQNLPPHGSFAVALNANRDRPKQFHK